MKAKPLRTLVCIVAAVCVVIAASLCVAEGESQRGRVPRQLDFLGEPILASKETRQQWVQGELSVKLGLTGNNTLNAMADGRLVNNHKVISLQQLYKSVPIVGLESSLALDKDSRPLFLLGKHHNFSGQYERQAKIDLEVALQKAGHVADSEYSQRLVYWSEKYQKLTLSYELEGSFAQTDGDAQPEYQRVYVDALRGVVLQRLTLVHSGKDRRVSDFGAACAALRIGLPINALLALPIEALAYSKFSRVENSSPSGNGERDKAFDLLGNGYDYIQQVIGMDSIDDNGKLLNLYINVKFHRLVSFPQCIGNEFNAVWVASNQSLYIPEQGLNFVEVMLHELGHGIISNGSNLEYAFQPGALNESIADAIGIGFRVWLELGKKSTSIGPIPRHYWAIRSPDGVIRDMADPSSVQGKYQYPDHYNKLFNWNMDTDSGGVHYNSSIMNMAFYLLAQGGQHPRVKSGVRVKGIGIFKAVKIYAQAGASLLQSRSDFEDARYAFARTAELLYGKSSQEWESVHQAMDAVGLPGKWVKAGSVTDDNVDANPAPQIDPLPDSEPEPQTIPQAEEKTKPFPEPQAESQPESEPERQPQHTPKTQDKVTVAETMGGQLIAWLMLGVAGVLVAALIMIRMRPQYGEKIISRGYPINDDKSDRGQNLPDTPPNNVGDHRDKYVGELIALEGTDRLPLSISYLKSKEGQVFGRAVEVVHVRIDSKQISRRHLRIRMIAGSLTIEDLNSSLGTRVDGNELDSFKPVVVKNGQIIKIADFSYVLNLK